MQITVQIADQAARALRQGERLPSGVRELGEVADELGVSFRALHPDSDDPVLRSYFTVEVPDPTAAQRVVDRLRQNPLVTAAYIKPPEAMP